MDALRELKQVRTLPTGRTPCERAWKLEPELEFEKLL